MIWLFYGIGLATGFLLGGMAFERWRYWKWDRRLDQNGDVYALIRPYPRPEV